MKVLIVGSGLIGVTSAYFLRRRGHEVTVIDRRESPGRETSFANGALLTPSMADPWNSPGSWRVLLASLGRSDAPLQLRLHALPSLMGWGVAFLRNSRAAAYERNALSNLRLAMYSLKVMETLRPETGIEYGRAARGTLRIFRDEAALDHASAWASRLSSQGLGFRRLSREETVDLEPALAPIAGKLIGAIHYPSDESGDAYKFCVALAERAERQGVEFRYRTEVSSLEMHSGRVTAVMSGRKRLVADKYLVAAGSYSTSLVQGAGVRLPVRPVKGYSVTFDDHKNRQSLGIPVIDDHWHAAVVPLQGAIRVAGTAEFTGFDLSPKPDRIRNLLALLKEVLPEEQFDPAAAKPWCGLRPVSADGVPIIGPSPIANLFVNCGHGHLGWTMAAGSGELIADLMCGDSPAISAGHFSLERFATAQ